MSKEMKPLTSLFAFAALLGATLNAHADTNADALLRTYDTGTSQQKSAIEQMVLTTEDAFREANSVIVLQRDELALFCLPPGATDLTAKQLIEMVRSEVRNTNSVGKFPFQAVLLHALQVTFLCPLNR
jgi:hypothetical protein